MWGGKDCVLKVLVSSESAALLFLGKNPQGCGFNAAFKANARMFSANTGVKHIEEILYCSSVW